MRLLRTLRAKEQLSGAARHVDGGKTRANKKRPRREALRGDGTGG